MIDNDRLLEERTCLRLESTVPQVGDYVIFPDGREERISHDWGEPGVQTSVSGSFYLGDGYASFSGALNPLIPTERLVDTGETKPGSFWFFSGDYARADNGVDVEAPCRVYRYAGETEGGS